MKSIYSLLGALFVMFTASAQPEGISWQQSLGGSEVDYFGGIAKRPDSGYFICGYSNSVDGDFSGNQGGYDIFVAALSPAGELENLETVGSSGFDQCNDLIALEAGGFAVLGRVGDSDGDITTGNSGSSDAWLGIFNDDLELIDQYGFGGNSLDEGEALIQTTDGGLLLTGRTSSSTGFFGDALGADDVFLIKLDSDYALEWVRRYGGSDWDLSKKVLETQDGFIVCGSSESSDNDLESNQGEDDAWVFKVDTEGNLVWSTTFGGSYFDSFYSIVPDIDDNFVLVGTSKFEDDEVPGVNSRFGLIVTISPEGEILSQMDVGTQADDELADVIVKGDGTRVCLGVTNGSFSLGGIGGSDYYLLEVDPSDNVSWEQVYGGSMGDGGYQLIDDEEGYVLAGQHVGSDGNIVESFGSFDVSVLRVGDVALIQGCTDPQACNYFADATIDDGSCEYLNVYAISGPTQSEAFMVESYSYPQTAGSTYEWTITGGEIINGQGTSEAEVQWTTADTPAELCVVETAAEGCVGEAVCLDVDVIVLGIMNGDDTKVQVYPNPAATHVNITLPEGWIGSNYMLVELSGSVVLEGQIERTPFQVPVESVAAGRYEFKLQSNGRVVTKPLIISE